MSDALVRSVFDRAGMALTGADQPRHSTIIEVRAEDDGILAYWTRRYLADGDAPEEPIRRPYQNKARST